MPKNLVPPTDTIPPAIDNTDTPQILPAKKRVVIRPFDVIALTVIALVIIMLAITLVNKIKLKHEVSNAQITTSRVELDIRSQNVTDIRSLADAKFNRDHSLSQLTSLLKPIGQIYGKSVPIVDQQGVSNTSSAQDATIIYKYNDLKLPFYVRIDVSRPHGTTTWHVVGISGNPDKTLLSGN